MSRLAASSDVAAVVDERALVVVDAGGARVGELPLDARGAAVERFGDEWLVLGHEQKHLVRVGEGERASKFASSRFAVGRSAIGAFAVSRDDAVAIARKGALELWSRDGERRWSKKGGPFARVVLARDHVVALGEDGALYFVAREKGAPLGALRLASPEPASEWRLAHVKAEIVVLALGEWLVWIDAHAGKTVRRVRARAKVLELTADAELVVVAVEDGHLQTFRAATGEPRAALAAGEPAVHAIGLGAGALFALEGEAVRAYPRQSLDAAVRVASPVTVIAARGKLAVVGDRAGRVRVFELASEEMREVASLSGGEVPVGLFVAKDEAIVAAGARVALRAPAPWSAPRPLALREAPSAFSADEAYAFVGSPAGNVDVYDLGAGRHLTTYALSPEDRITALLRLPGALLVVGTGALDGRVLFVDVAAAKVVHRVAPHDEAFAVTCLASDARGRIVASGSDDGSVALLDPAKGRALARLRVRETPVSMAFEPSGKRLACVFGDGTAAIVTFAPKGATLVDLGLRGARCVAWADRLVFGFEDGRIENGDRHLPSS